MSSLEIPGFQPSMSDAAPPLFTRSRNVCSRLTGDF
jgi:hypothetical protein